MKKILITCQCATNKGDRAIAEYLISRLNLPDVLITLSTTEPILWESAKKLGVKVIGTGYTPVIKSGRGKISRKIAHEISSFYYNKVLFPELIDGNGACTKCCKHSKAFVEEIMSADLVIVTGGHHITSLRNRNALFAITYDIGLVAKFSKKYVLWSQTIGPLSFDDKKVENYFGKVLSGASRVYIRDDNSAECVKSLYGNIGNICKSYDSVFGFGCMDFPDFSKRGDKIGISVFNGLPKAFDIIPGIAAIIDYFVEKGCKVEFFRMEKDDTEMNYIRQVIHAMKTNADISVFPFASSTVDHLTEMASCKYFIGYKTHSVIMSLTTATPLIGICYHKKTFDFMKDYGMESYSVNDDELTTEAGAELAGLLYKNASKINIALKNHSRVVSEVVFHDLNSLIRY